VIFRLRAALTSEQLPGAFVSHAGGQVECSKHEDCSWCRLDAWLLWALG